MKEGLFMHVKKLFLTPFLLILSLILFTACQSLRNPLSPSNSDSSTPMGRYIESNWDLSAITQNPNSISMLMDVHTGKPNLYIDDKNTLKLYVLNENGQFIEEKLPWLDAFKQYPYDISPSVISNTGKLYFQGEIKMGEPIIAELKDNQIKQVPIEWATPTLYTKDIAAVDDNILFILHNDEILRQYDTQTGKCTKQYPDEPFSCFELSQGVIYAIPTSNTQLDIIDATTMKLTRHMPLPCKDVDANLTIDQSTGDLYFVSSEGIWRTSPSGTVWEQVVDGHLCSLSSTSISRTNTIVFNNEFFIEYAPSSSYSYIYKKLSYSSTTPTHPSKELIVYCLRDDFYYGNNNDPVILNSTIKEALNAYQAQHPDVGFKFIVGVNDSTSEEQAIQSLNTELLSGKGPDIILLNGLPASSYAKQGLFSSLNDCIDPLVKSNKILSGVSTGYQYNHNIYAVPLRFKFTTLWGKASILNSTHSLHDLALYQKAHPNEQLYQYEEPDYLIRLFYPLCSPSWLTQNGELDKSSLQTFLEDIKTLSLKGKDYEIRSSHWYYSYAMALLYNKSQVHVVSNDNIGLITGSAYANSKLKDYSYKLFEDHSNSCFITSNLFAINAHSQYQDIAKDILKTSLSEDIQFLNLNDGFPVNSAALKRWFSGELFAQTRHPDTNLAPYGSTYDNLKYEFYKWADYKDVLQDLYKRSVSLSTPANENQKTLQIILDDSKAYFDGTATLDEVTNTIYEKLNLYLNE